MPHARHAGHMYRTHTHVTYRPYVCSRCRCVKQICAVKLIFVYPFLLFHFSKNNLVPTGSTLHGATALVRWRLRWRLRAGAWRRSCGTESPVSGLECGDPDRHEGWYCIELSLINRVLKPSSTAPSGDPPQRCHQRWAPEPEP